MDKAMLELMQNYVEAPEQSPAIDELEREKRKEAANYARASIGLEGFKFDEETERKIERFIEGDIDLQELVGKRG